MALCFSSLSAKSKEPYRASVQQELKADKYNRQLGYQIINGGETVAFVFNPDTWKIKKPKRVFVEGSFNGWSKKNSNWELAKLKDSLWVLECPADDIKIPGNSGFPEFKFMIIADVEYIETVCGKELTRYKTQTFEPKAVSHIAGFQMDGNNLILFPEDDPAEPAANAALLKKAKKLKEFNLENPEERAQLANFRRVPGTTQLFRGYHPYKASRLELDTEKPRLAAVSQLIKENGIQSIITLSGDETVDPSKETISVYIGDIRRKGNQFFTDTKYNTVYYQSSGRDFGNMIGDIVRFINTHPAPYYVHCRLGSDRTGVVCAVLAALCGASWNDIAADYQKTNETGIQEVRDHRLLQYSFEQMLGKPLSEVQDLQQEMKQFFIERRFFTKEDFDALNQNLKK